MPEEAAEYTTQKDYAVIKAYSLDMLTIGRISDLSQRLAISQGAVVRQAVAEFWAKYEAQT